MNKIKKILKSKIVFSMLIVMLVGIFFVSYNFLTKNKFNNKLKINNANIKQGGGLSDAYTPQIKTLNIVEIGDNEEQVKNLILNLPADAKYIGFKNQPDTATKGPKTAIITIVFSDNSYKEYTFSYKVYEVEWILPQIEADVKNQTIKEGDPINTIRWNVTNVVDSYDDANYKTKKVNPQLANYILNPNGLNYTPFNGSGGQGILEGTIKINWKNNEEEQRVIEIVNYTPYEKSNNFIESKATIIVNRDTDKDGTVDSEDLDDDGDGISDADEILYNSNPKINTSLPNQAALYKVKVLQKTTLKYYVNDEPNILDAITSDKTLLNANKIKSIKIKENITTDQKGEKIGKVEFEFEDCSTLEIEVIVKVFEKEIVAPKLVVNKDSQELLEGRIIQDVIFSRENIDTSGSEFVDKLVDDVVNQTLTIKSLVLPIDPSLNIKEKTEAKDYSSPVNANQMYPPTTVYNTVQWGDNERAIFTLEAEVLYKTKGKVTKQSVITLLRDTDQDGKADEIDDDDDGDGVSDLDEKNKYHTNPKDATSKPTDSELHGNEVITKEFVVYENDPVDILEGITAMPEGAIKRITKNVDTSEKGLKEGEVEVTFKDTSKKTYKINVKVYKKVYVTPKLVVKENENTEIIEGKPIKTIKFAIEEPTNLGRDEEQYIEKIRDNPTVNGATAIIEGVTSTGSVTGLNSNLNPALSIDVSGNPVFDWQADNSERATIKLKGTINSTNNPSLVETSTTFILLRDTDRDGNADEIDDDDDGDGVSDTEETRTGHNPKDRSDKPTLAELDQTDIDTKVLRTYVNETIDLTKGVINKPANTTLEVSVDIDYSQKGKKTATIKVKFQDNSFKEVNVDVNVFEKQYIKPTVTATPNQQSLIESNNIQEVTINKTVVNGSINDENFIEYIVDNVISEGFVDLKGLTFGGNKLNGKLNITWDNNVDENKLVTLTHKIKYQHLPDTDTLVKFNVDRDTDRDGQKDSEDLDDDNDTFTDQEEKDNNSDPKDSSSIPSQADIYKLRHLTKKKLKAYIGDTVDIKKGITSSLTGHDIKNVNIFINTNTTVKGDDKSGTVRITFMDTSHLDVEILTDVFEKQYIKGNLVANPENQTAIEKKHITQVMFQINKVNQSIDEDNNIDYIPDEIITNTVEVQNATNLSDSDISNTLTVGKLVTGIPTLTWQDNNEVEKTVKVINKIKYKNLGTVEKSVNIKILRDTDGDETPDKLDEDDDDDGYDDEDEIKAGTNPKDKNDKPNNAATGEVITQILKGYVGDNLDEKLAIKSKPENATLEVINEFNTSTKGKKEATVRVKYPDNSHKDYKVYANIFEKQYLIHDVNVENNNQRVIESKNIKNITLNKTINGIPGVDVDQYIEKIIDPLNSENYDNLYNLVNSSNVLSGKVKINNWNSNEETRTIKINYKRGYANNGTLNTVINITVDRDTDNDETPDKDDDDDDNDGVSDIDEIRTGHNPKDASDKPTKAELDQTVVNINTNLETMVNKPIDITTAVINKPSDTTVHIKTPIDFSSKGQKTGVIEIRYSDNSKKEYNVPVKVYELQYVKPTVTVENNNTNILEGRNIQNIKFKKSSVDISTDEANFIKKELDQVLSEDIVITGANLNKANDEVSGIPTVSWTGQEETKTVVVKKVITYKNLPQTEVSTVFTVDRDTDHDGTKDSEDDDDDGDGISDTEETRTGHNPKDRSDKPTLSELDDSNILNKILEAYVGDTVDITTGIINKPANTTLEIATPANTTTKGLKQGTVKVKYTDGSFKNVTINVKVYEKEYVKPSINVTNTNSSIIDKHPIQNIVFNKVNPEIGKNDGTYIEKILDTETTNTVNNLFGLVYSSDTISGTITINNWGPNEESRIINFNNIRTYNNLSNTVTSTSIVVNRDTDNDGTIDSEDDDDDGDGISDVDENKTGHDPKNPTDKPTQSELDNANIISEILNVELNDTVDITTAITNKPSGTTLRVKTPVTTTSKGQKKGVVEIVYSDGSTIEKEVKVNVYEVRYLVPNVTINNPNIEVIDPDNIKEVTINVSEVIERVDENNFIKYKKDELISETITNLNGLTNSSNQKLSGKVSYIFTGNEEIKNIDIPYTRVYRHSPQTVKNIKFKLLRDTDRDRIPDIRDADKDGDGYSNVVEIAKGTDPYDPSSVPTLTKKEQLDELIKKLEKLIEDTKREPYQNKNKLDVDHLKNQTLPDKENKKNIIKNSYDGTTSDSELENKKREVQKHIDDINREINNLRDKANFDELNKEIAKPIEEIYTIETLRPLKEKIEEAKNLSRDSATQTEVDNLTREIKNLRAQLRLNKNKLKEKIEELDKAIDNGKCLREECKKTSEKAKNGYNDPNLTKDEYVQLLNEIDAVLHKSEGIKNPRTSSSQFIIVILISLILVIIYILFKTKKSYLR